MSTSHKIFLASLLALVIIGGGLLYHFFLKEWLEKSELGREALLPATLDTSAADEVVRVLATLKGVLSIDTEFLDGEVFESLYDFTLAIPEIPKGRKNPFAPIGNAFIKGNSGGKIPVGSPSKGGAQNVFVIP